MADNIELTGEDLLSFCKGQTFATIYADPPWRFQNRTGKVAPEHKRLNRYATMSLDEIKAHADVFQNVEALVHYADTRRS